MTVKKGDRGTKVKKVQYKLGLKTDGIFGSGTEHRVTVWQDSVGLTPDGIMGQTSWWKMFGSKIEDFTPIGIVVHSMSEEFKWEGETITAGQLLNRLGLSVHVLIHPDGQIQTLNQTNVKCAHAGQSEHNGLTNLNSFFLGFELLVQGLNSYGEFVEKIDKPDCYTDAQIKAATLMTQMWCSELNIRPRDVVRHSDVSGDDIRGKGKGKVDPGNGFPWEEFKANLR